MSTLLSIVIAIVSLAVTQTPARDSAAQRLGPATGVIRGKVTTDDSTPRPVRKAVVTLVGDVPAALGAITDDEGAFVFTNLPAGRFTVSVKKPAWLPAAYGAARPGRPGTPISLAAGQEAAVTITMSRGAVLTGILRDGHGRPMPGVQVQADSTRRPSANTPPAGTSQTDDRGQYRIYGLLPGSYRVSAKPTLRGSGPIGVRSTEEMDALLAEIARRRSGAAAMPDATARRAEPPIPPPPAVGYVAVYYPGTWVASEATPITVAAGDERGNLDFPVAPVGTARIEGAISGAVTNLGAVQLTITLAGQQGMSSSNANPVLTKRPGEDGRFEYTNIAPGHYTIMARLDPNAGPVTAQPNVVGLSGGGGPGAAEGGAGRPAYLYAVAEVDARGTDITGLTLTLQPGSVLTGRVQFESESTPTPDFSRITIGAGPVTPTGTMVSGGTMMGNGFAGVPAVQVSEDGTFILRALAPGPYTLRPALQAGTAGDWWVKSAVAGGRDVLDYPLEFKPGENVSGLVLTYSNRHSELSGTLQTNAGAPASEFFVLAFPADPALWQPRSRRIKSVRPGSDGTYAIKDLPAGNYFLAALTDVEPADLEDAKFLEQIAPAALRLTLGDGEKKTQDLRIAR